MLEKTYIWMHTHFPYIVDCQPIALEELVSQAGFDLAHHVRIDLFTMPVAIAVGINSLSPSDERTLPSVVA